MTASNWTSDDDTTTLLQKLVNNLGASAIDAGAASSDVQSWSSSDSDTQLLQKAVTNSYLLAQNL